MTDGIIHQVFNTPDNTFAKQIIDNFESSYAQMILDYYKQSLERKQQELIEKIKQESIHVCCDKYTIELERLIGDNKE